MSLSTARQTCSAWNAALEHADQRKREIFRMTPASRHASRAVMLEHTLNYSFCAPYQPRPRDTHTAPGFSLRSATTASTSTSSSSSSSTAVQLHVRQPQHQLMPRRRGQQHVKSIFLSVIFKSVIFRWCILVAPNQLKQLRERAASQLVTCPTCHSQLVTQSQATRHKLTNTSKFTWHFLRNTDWI